MNRNRTSRKAIAVLLCLVMLLGLCPLSVFAAPIEMEITQYETGWENWGGGSYGNATQLLIQMDRTDQYSPQVLYDHRDVWDFELIIRADSTGKSKTIHMAPTSAYLPGSWGILRFETCEGVEPNRFVPTYGETYTVTLNVYEDGRKLYTGTSDGYYCSVQPVYHGQPVVSEPNGTVYTSWGTDPVYLGDNRFAVEFFDDLATGVSIGDRWTVVYADRRYVATITGLPDEDGYCLEFQIESGCRFGHGKTYTIYLEGCSGFAGDYYFPITFTTEAVDYADILLSPSGSGWENGSYTAAGYTAQLVMMVEDTDDCLARDLFALAESGSWSLRITGDLRDETLQLAPASFTKKDAGGILRFETCAAGERFIPISGFDYRVELSVVDVNGTVYYGAADSFRCTVLPYVDGAPTDLRNTVIKSEWVIDGKSVVTYSRPGDVPSYTGPEPTKKGDPRYTYKFSHWDHEPEASDHNQTFIACFEKQPALYRVDFYVDGVCYTQQSGYGELPTFSGALDKVDPEGKRLYEFVGWSPALHPTVGEERYVAQYKVTEIGSLTVTPVVSEYQAATGLVTVDLVVSGNRNGYHGFSFGLDYEPHVMTLLDAAVLPDGYSYVNRETAGQVNFGWTDLTECKTDGVVARASFRVNEIGAKSTNFAVSKTVGRDLFFYVGEDGYEKELYFTAAHTQLQLTGRLPGDLNEDGILSITDVSTLLVALSNGSLESKFDVNGDGAISIGDVSALLLML